MTGPGVELATRVELPKRSFFDVRGGSGPWIDYFRATYPEWAVPSDAAEASPVPWPPGFEPHATPVFAHNEISIAAPGDVVFRALCDARRWPRYYENASGVALADGAERLGAGTSFHFTTFGVRFSARVVTFEPDRALAWWCAGGFPRVHVHHRWLLEPDGGGTLLVTEETNFVATLRRLGLARRVLDRQFARSGLREALPAAHQRWLTALKREIEGAAAAG